MRMEAGGSREAEVSRYATRWESGGWGAQPRSKLISSCGNDFPYFPVSFSRPSRAKAMSQHVVTPAGLLSRTEVLRPIIHALRYQ